MGRAEPLVLRCCCRIHTSTPPRPHVCAPCAYISVLGHICIAMHVNSLAGTSLPPAEGPPSLISQISCLCVRIPDLSVAPNHSSGDGCLRTALTAVFDYRVWLSIYNSNASMRGCISTRLRSITHSGCGAVQCCGHSLGLVEYIPCRQC